MADKWINAEQRAKRKRLIKETSMANAGISQGDLALDKLMQRATSNPQGIEKDDLFKILTGKDIPGTNPNSKAAAKQFALDRLGPDSRAKALVSQNRSRNKEILNLFAAFNPGDPFFKALYSGLRGK
jgi:hypothetical protein